MTIQSTSLATTTLANVASKQHDALSKTLEQIAAAKKVSMDDASSSSISDMLESQISGLNAGVMNGNQAIGVLQIAEGTLSSLSKSSDELSRLSVAYHNDALSDDQKRGLVSQAHDIKSSMQEAINTATFNGESVFGAKAFDLGSSVHNVNASTPVLSSLDITDGSSIKSFTDTLSSSRSEIGSSINAIVSTVSNNISTSSALQSARSQLNDVDIATVMNEKTKNEIQMNAALLVQAHSAEYLQKMGASLLR